MLKYIDKEGALITMTSRQDVQSYAMELIAQHQRQQQQTSGPKLGGSQVPSMKIQVVRVAREVRRTRT